VVGRLEGVTLSQLMPNSDEVSGEVHLDCLKDLNDMLDQAFRDQEKAATAQRKLLRLKQRDREL
jgi:hypothetical protein